MDFSSCIVTTNLPSSLLSPILELSPLAFFKLNPNELLNLVVFLFADTLHVKYLGGDPVPKTALDHCSSWNR